MKRPKKFSPAKTTNPSFKKKRLYDTTDWFNHSRKFLLVNPKCYCCGETARVVDHVVSHKGDEEKFWNETNMIPMCKKCHSVVTGFFDRHVPPKTEEKMRWIANKRAETGTVVRVKPIEIK